MEVIRRNTDYAFRLMAYIAMNEDKGPVSVRKLAQSCSVPYQLACKLLQKLSTEGLLVSTMGAKGGYALALPPSKISLKEIIDAVQGPICLNLCINDDFFCPLKEKCPINGPLAKLQKDMDHHFASNTLDVLLK